MMVLQKLRNLGHTMHMWLRGYVTVWWTLVLALCLLLSIASTTYMFTHNLAKSEQRTLVSAQINTCRKDNVTRALDNISHYADYIQLTTQNPHPNAVIRQVIDDKIWTPLSDCGTSNGREALEAFTISSKKPPASALDILNATRVDPVGSINPQALGVHLTKNKPKP